MATDKQPATKTATPEATEKNKGGRPKGAINKTTRELRELAQSYTPLAIDTLVAMIRQKKAPMARLAAVNILLDRAYGKPTQAISGDADGPPIMHEVRRIIVDPNPDKGE